MSEMDEFNAKVASEFRANGGKVGGRFEGAPMLLLHSTGARSGKAYMNPLVYLRDGDRWVIIASKAGAPKSPSWYHNLVAHKSAEIEVGTEKVAVKVEVVTGDERDRLFARQVAAMPVFAEYESRTARVIPVVALTRA